MALNYNLHTRTHLLILQQCHFNLASSCSDLKYCFSVRFMLENRSDANHLTRLDYARHNVCIQCTDCDRTCITASGFPYGMFPSRKHRGLKCQIKFVTHRYTPCHSSDLFLSFIFLQTHTTSMHNKTI